MKIAILDHQLPTYFFNRLKECVAPGNHDIQFIQLSYCYMNISSKAPSVFYRNNVTVENLDALIPRILPQNTFYGTALLRQFERMGIYTLNGALAISWTRDKLRTLQHLAKKQLPMPITGSADSPHETEKLIELVGGAPLIIRLLEGSQGRGTIFAETHQAAVSVVNAVKQLKTNILVQEYIKEAQGQDVRIVVIGNKVITSVLRRAKEAGLPLQNLPIEASVTNISPEEKKIAIQAAQAMKLNFATVDILRSNRGPLILDIDPCPNIEILEKDTQVDIVTPLIHFIETHAKSHD